jgi:cytochrome c553
MTSPGGQRYGPGPRRRGGLPPAPTGADVVASEAAIPDLVGLTPQERLAHLDAAAAQYVSTQRPANTIKAYAQDWKVWEDYTADLGIPLLSGTAGALTGFVVWLERGRVPRSGERTAPAAPSTVERRLTGAIAGLRGHNVHIDPETRHSTATGSASPKRGPRSAAARPPWSPSPICGRCHGPARTRSPAGVTARCC